MESMQGEVIYPPLANNHISVDCVVIGFDGTQLNVLLVNRHGEEDGLAYHDMKLPGSLIYQDEDLDGAALRVLNELTGVKNIKLMQFRAYGSKNRTSDPKDVHWLERAQQARVERIVTISYLALVKIDRAIDKSLDAHKAGWVPLNDVKRLAFDHNLILTEAMHYIRDAAEVNPVMLFDLLPRKFTASQLRTMFELIYGHAIDVRNFHKKIAMMDYVVPLEERQQGVAHRAARYYKFDRKIYNKNRR
ncbi:NUDIX domain-containing protein [Muribaculum gordoncarteri]|uniref:NUDIX hydrolase n=5 Tax=Muribaculum TaxID=1918540 RepID=A0A4P7VQ84_9BACT|nr:NUDIX domain-containing protein [Muribaculum gordoncarteri]QCD36434.1 NUDIX hydrolase [Muribaculum gordoncarteri]ROT14747.1 NUDIX hydrolase [Muribaculaceae bacterium Isolate-102 (HZI)]